jgi:hypothetical protein
LAEVKIVDREKLDPEFVSLLEKELKGYDVVLVPSYNNPETRDEKRDVIIIEGLVFDWNLIKLREKHNIHFMFSRRALRLYQRE